MREIKFRVWRTTSKTMHFIDAIGTIPILSKETPKKYVVMQFTGLKDKNNKEIYEEDIFDSPSGNKFKVVWYKDGWFHQHILDNHPVGHLIEVAKDWEVIGNIYENPELLK